MIYLIYGKETFLIQKELKNIKEQEQIDNININEYDLNETPLIDILDDANTISLFDSKKMIIVNNSFIFTGKKGAIEQKTDLLEQYLQNIVSETILCFLVNEEKLDERKKIGKQIKQKGIIKECNQINPLSYVKEELKGYNITEKTLNFLISRVGKNLNILSQEIEKIKTYKDSDKNITEQDILLLTTENIDIDIFGLIESIVNHDLKKAITSYHEMLKYNEEPIKIIVMLANQFRIIYQAKEMYKKGYTESDIASTLCIHPYRIKLALEKGRGYESTTLLNYLKKLADLDEGIKKGTINKEIGLELFILNL